MYYHYPYFPYPQGSWDRSYPPVDTTLFNQSVLAFQKMASEAATLLNKLAEPAFAHQLMSAAQQGHQQEVDHLIKSVGVPYAVTTRYTPTGIQLSIHADVQGSECCSLSMFLRWGH
ncbi:MAG TPA: hypothetical protein VJ824_05010 [Bacillota bacterium]|nr:hypothetical protein [Bacillota bacterium]